MLWRVARSLMIKLTKFRRKFSNLKKKRKGLAWTLLHLITQIPSPPQILDWITSRQITLKEKSLISAITSVEPLFKQLIPLRGQTTDLSLRELKTMTLSGKGKNWTKGQGLRKIHLIGLIAKSKSNWRRAIHLLSKPVNLSVRALQESVTKDKKKIVTLLNQEKSHKRHQTNQKNKWNIFLINPWKKRPIKVLKKERKN
jgi:hypothetical protein